MPAIHRRRFLGNALIGSFAVAANSVFRRFAFAGPEVAGRSRLFLDPAQKIARLDRRVLGSFLEHLGRAIYGGIYEPGSKLADSNGFRKDVLAEIKQLGVPMIRYPGGNFVSGYNWLDGVGPKGNRPRVVERAWNSVETNQFGTNEFISWCRAVDTEPLLAVNMGTGMLDGAVALLEYCNLEKGTRWSDLRRQHGIEKPYGVKYWCLGNEMDVGHQIGNMPAREYGRKANVFAHQMRIVDPSLQLIACGSTVPFLATYLEWDRQVLEECYEVVDGISTHRYFGNEVETGGDTRKYLALNLAMDRQIEEVAAICDTVQARKRSSKRLWLSFDEWNVWYRAMSQDEVDGRQKEAPPLLEEVYNLEDALLVGGIINTLLRHADRVRVGCLAQLVNVIAPLMTNADSVLRQTIYYPYAWALKYAHGDVLDVALESDTYEVGEIKRMNAPYYGEVYADPLMMAPRIAQIGRAPYLDAVATMDPDAGTAALFILNRDLDKSRDLEVVWRENPPKRVLACEVLTGDDLKAFNSFEAPNRVVPQPLEPPKVSSRMTFKLPPRSYTAVSLAMI